MLRRIARWAARRGIAAELVGVDLNPRSERAARLHTPPGLAIRWVTGDYADLAGGGWDVIISSLVAHHMTHAQLVARSEEHMSELQSLMRISYAVFCLKKKKTNKQNTKINKSH